MKYSPYSASKFNTFYDCPFKFKCKYKDHIKVPYVPQPFFEKGKFIHYCLEHYPITPKEKFKFELSTKDDIKRYKKLLFEILKSKKVKDLLKKDSCREKEFFISKEYEKAEKKKGSLFTGYIDYITDENEKSTIIDWKTGKIYKKKTSIQLKIYALWKFLENSNINTIKCKYFYVEHNKESVFTFERKNLKEMIDLFNEEINKIENTKVFKKKPCYNCKYCDYEHICEPQKRKEI